MRVLIVDDEPLARERISGLIAEDGRDEVVGECGDGLEAVEAIAAGRPDLVFLDVQMPEMDGFGVIEAVGVERMPQVVFVTAYDQYALKAFEVHALDYLLKPFGDERFAEALAAARAQVALRSAVQQSRQLIGLLSQLAAARDETLPPELAPRGRHVERLRIKAGDRVYFIRVADIDRFEAFGNYVKVFVGAKTHLVREPLSALEAKLDPDRFARIHRGTILNMERVREIQPWFGGDQIIVLRDGGKLKLSRNFRDAFLERLARAP